jgi:hypothetical protein
MEGEHPLAENHGMSPQRGEAQACLPGADPCGGMPAQERACMEKLLTADWGGRRDEALTAEELLLIGKEAFEPLFHEPPIGPIPDYLAPHLSVHGCVAEYEEKYEELDCWKILQLDRWLKGRSGKRWCIASKIYELRAETEQGGASGKFRLRLIEHPPGCEKPAAGEI